MFEWAASDLIQNVQFRELQIITDRPIDQAEAQPDPSIQWTCESNL